MLSDLRKSPTALPAAFTTAPPCHFLLGLILWSMRFAEIMVLQFLK